MRSTFLAAVLLFTCTVLGLLILFASSDLAIAVTLCLGMAACVSGVLNLLMNPKAIRFALGIFWASLFLRLAVAIAIHYYAPVYFFTVDDVWFDQTSAMLAESWQGKSLSPDLRDVIFFGWIYFMAGLYYVFGHLSLLAKLVNALLGASTVVVVYAIGKELRCEERTARFAALATAVFPSLVLWSATALRDAPVIFLVAVTALLVLRLQRELAMADFVLLVVCYVALGTLRPYLFVVLSLAATFSLALTRMRKARNAWILAILMLLVWGGYEYLGFGKQYFGGSVFGKVDTIRYYTARAGDSGYGSSVVIRTSTDALLYLPTGLFYFLLTPVPFWVSGKRQLLTVPEMLVWYVLFLFALRGIAHTVRHNLRRCIPLYTYILILTFGYAIGETNMGTAYRHRAQVLTLLLVFSAIGLFETKLRRRYAQPALQPNIPNWRGQCLTTDGTPNVRPHPLRH